MAGLVAGNLRLIHPPLPTFLFAPLPKSLPSLRCPVSSLRGPVSSLRRFVSSLRRSVSSLPRRREPSPAHALDARLRGHDEVRARYALDNLPNKVLAAEYRTVLPNEKLIAEELERSRRELEARRLVEPPMEGEA